MEKLLLKCRHTIKRKHKAKVDELLGNTALKEVLEKYQNNITLNSKVRDNRDLER